MNQTQLINILMGFFIDLILIYYHKTSNVLFIMYFQIINPLNLFF